MARNGDRRTVSDSEIRLKRNDPGRQSKNSGLPIFLKKLLNPLVFHGYFIEKLHFYVLSDMINSV